MALFLFPKYTRAGASSRYRTFQYLSLLEATGLRFSVSPLFDDAYLANKYAYGRAGFANVLLALAKRVWAVLIVPRGSVVVLEYELLPWFPALLERWLAWRGCQMVVDYDDALFHQYDAHSSFLVRKVLGHKIATVMRLAHTVVAGNAYLADYALRAGAKHVEVIPTVIDLARYPVKRAVGTSGVFTIGWIGSPSTARYLRDIAPALAQVCQDGRVRVRLVGSGAVELPGVPVEVIAWREETEVDEICRFDIGIMPLPDEPWARGKCGFKLIQYMACGLPVVASPVGVNADIVDHEVNGLLAREHSEWVAALKRLIADSSLRRRMGDMGRSKAQRQYCLEVTAPQLVELLLNVQRESTSKFINNSA